MQITDTHTSLILMRLWVIEMLSGDHYLASNFLFYTYYVQIVQVEDMIESTNMLWWKQIVCVLQFTFVWPCIVTNFFIIKPTRCTKFKNLFWHETLHVSDSFSVHLQEFIHCTLSDGVCQDRPGFQFHPGPARKLSTNLYDIYHCCVYSE